MRPNLLIGLLFLASCLSAESKTILICSLPRTGSTLLCRDMTSTGVLGNGSEYLHDQSFQQLAVDMGADPMDLDDYLSKIREKKSSANGVMAIKIFPSHLYNLAKKGLLPLARGTQLDALIKKIGGEVVIVKLFRRNKLRQAISFVKAVQSDQWGAGDEATLGKTIRYDLQGTERAIVNIVRWEAYWAEQFEISDCHPELELYYEDYVNERESTLVRIAELLSIPDAGEVVMSRDVAAVKLKRQSDDLTEVWRKRFIASRNR